ncbi:MAG: LPS assembly lipoprotein LptE [Akkermansia sp.]|nr:LPS assembly lipoprotein LptE [Akkermansia sp.]
MKTLSTITMLAGCLLTVSCGYHLDGALNPKMQGVKSFAVSVFQNETMHPDAAMMVTTALTDSLEKSGTMRLASHGAADCTISGKVVSVERTSLRANPQDSTYSSEIGLTVNLVYTVTDNRTGKVLVGGRTSGIGSFFNNDLGSVQTAEQNAVSYAARQAAEDIVTDLTLP